MSNPELSLDFWMLKGKEVGLAGEQLFVFAEGKWKEIVALAKKEEADRIAREERAREREERAKERDHEAKLLEIENDEKNRKLEEQRLALEEKKFQLSIDSSVQGNNRPTQSDFSSSSLKMTKMPVFSDGDDITAYLIRFENLATLCQWPEDSWATRLALLFSGTSLNVYSTLPDDVVKNYQELKKSILKAFKKTPEQYRKEFRYSKITSNQNFSQFLTNLFRLFDYWVESAKIDKTHESLRDFIVGDQFLTSLPNEIRMFLKENNDLQTSKMAEIADNYACAHKCYPGDKKQPKPKPKPEHKSNNDEKPETQPKTIKCYSCGEIGHTKAKCQKRMFAEQKIQKCFNESNDAAPFASGTINGSYVSTILRDTGCSCVVVSSKVLPNLVPSNYPTCKLTDYLGRSDNFPVVRCFLSCKWYTGWVDAVIAPIKFCSVLLGNITGATCPTDDDCVLGMYENSEDIVDTDLYVKPKSVNVATRSSVKVKPIHPLIVPEVESLDMSHNEFLRLQNSCESLENIRKAVVSGQVFEKKKYSFKFIVTNGIIYKHILTSANSYEVGKDKLVIPSDCRLTVLKLSHDLPVAGHFSHRKTLLKIQDLYYWPGMCTDIYNYCRSCDICQRCSQKGRTKNASLVKMPVFTVPFERVGVDIVGPIKPCSSQGHKYILTLIDYTTSFPDAVALKHITSIDVAEALLSIFSRVGVPKEILTDRGSQFTSDLMDKINELIGVKPMFTTPYHPMCNGRIERQHSILKSVLKKLCISRPKDWDRYIPCALFAMREIPSDSLGFSPFELLYGRQGRGPLTILNELWTNPNLNTETQSSYRFLLDLRNRLQETAELAASQKEISMKQYKTYFDVKSSNRCFKVNDEVLILLPDNSNKLLMTWRGPYKITKVVNRVDYLVDVDGKNKLYHVNLLKRYFRRRDIALNIIDKIPVIENIFLLNVRR